MDRHTILSDQLATRSARKDALFSQVLLACALAPKHKLGFFTSGAIRYPLEEIAGRRIEIPAFSNHLSQFLEAERGAVLHREGTSRRYFYRFTDPILQPFVILTGLSEAHVTEDQIRLFQNRDGWSDVIPGERLAHSAPAAVLTRRSRSTARLLPEFSDDFLGGLSLLSADGHLLLSS